MNNAYTTFLFTLVLILALVVFLQFVTRPKTVDNIPYDTTEHICSVQRNGWHNLFIFNCEDVLPKE